MEFDKNNETNLPLNFLFCARVQRYRYRYIHDLDIKYFSVRFGLFQVWTFGWVIWSNTRQAWSEA